MEFKSLFLTTKGKIAILFPVIASGVLYVIYQWYFLSDIVDTLFIGLLFSASILLVIGISRIGNQLNRSGDSLYINIENRADDDYLTTSKNIVFEQIINSPLIIISGLVYGSIIATAPYILNAWPNNLTLLVSLSVFLFFVNTLTGMGLYGIFRFIMFTHDISGKIQIELWQANSKVTDYLLSAIRNLSLLSSAYIAISMISIIFSVFTFGTIVLSYAVFSGMVLVLVVIVTPRPIVKTLRKAKLISLNEIDARIELLYKKFQSEEESFQTDIVDRLKNLLELREKIENMNIVPYRVKSIITVLTIIILSILPVIIEVLLNYYF